LAIFPFRILLDTVNVRNFIARAKRGKNFPANDVPRSPANGYLDKAGHRAYVVAALWIAPATRGVWAT
jgi:hypothetical protein